MQKRHPERDGAVLLGGMEHAFPTQFRPIIQANDQMRFRLKALLWGFPWTWEARRG